MQNQESKIFGLVVCWSFFFSSLVLVYRSRSVQLLYIGLHKTENHFFLCKQSLIIVETTKLTERRTFRYYSPGIATICQRVFVDVLLFIKLTLVVVENKSKKTIEERDWNLLSIFYFILFLLLKILNNSCEITCC